ncbi:hypothetical protein [Candidatus Palauibacter sp.]|uniref:hypothetical protein n=1 Tax=Candidatus Palauibacter sp. TaxID=3101350 RepID=UPI003C6F9332
MDKIARAMRDYAARRFVPLSHGAFPLTRRWQPFDFARDFAVVFNDFNIVIRDLNDATWRVLVEHGYPSADDPALLSPSFCDPHDAALYALGEPAVEIEDDPVFHADQADLFPDWNR